MFSRLNTLSGFWAGNSYVAGGVDFDGTDYMLHGSLSGMSDGKSGILSCWVRIDTLVPCNILQGGSEGGLEDFAFAQFDTGRFVVSGDEAGAGFPGQLRLYYNTVNAFTTLNKWYHVLASWDLTVASAHHLYIDDVEELDEASMSHQNATINYTFTTPGYYVSRNVFADESKLNGCLADLYFAPNQYLDFSVEANRRKFISQSKKPVLLGDDGSYPTGTAPAIFCHINKGEDPANFAINRGSGGGNFTITGTLNEASTSPSG